MKTVKAVRALQNLPAVGRDGHFFKAGDIIAEILPGSIYYRPLSMAPPDDYASLIGIPIHEKDGTLDPKWFEEVDPIPFKDSPTFAVTKAQAEFEIADLEKAIEQFQTKLDVLKDMVGE
jgi:hypothetical protein